MSFIECLRNALREELDATNTYDELLREAPEEYKAIIEEIRNDEINHQGRILAMILQEEPYQLGPFNRGLDQKE